MRILKLPRFEIASDGSWELRGDESPLRTPEGGKWRESALKKVRTETGLAMAGASIAEALIAKFARTELFCEAQNVEMQWSEGTVQVAYANQKWLCAGVRNSVFKLMWAQDTEGGDVILLLTRGNPCAKAADALYSFECHLFAAGLRPIGRLRIECNIFIEGHKVDGRLFEPLFEIQKSKAKAALRTTASAMAAPCRRKPKKLKAATAKPTTMRSAATATTTVPTPTTEPTPARTTSPMARMAVARAMRAARVQRPIDMFAVGGYFDDARARHFWEQTQKRLQ